MLFSFTLLPPMAIDLIYREHTIDAFLTSYFVLFGAGFVLWLPVKNVKKDDVESKKMQKEGKLS